MFGLYTKPFPPITTDYLTNYQWSNVSDDQKLLIKPRSAIRESWKEKQTWYRGHNQGFVGLDNLGRGIGRGPGGRKLLNCGTFEDVDVLRRPGYNISLNFGSLLKPLCNLHNIMVQAIGTGYMVQAINKNSFLKLQRTLKVCSWKSVEPLLIGVYPQ